MQENFVFSGSSTPVAHPGELVPQQHEEYCRSFFWFAADEYFRTTVYFSPARQDAHNQHVVKVYDVDGQLANEVNLKFTHRLPGLLELDGLVANCKIKAGIRQGNIEVISMAGTAHFCEISSAQKDLSVSPVTRLHRERAGFYPLHLSTKSQTILVLNSLGAGDSMVKLRLYTGTRSPEIELKLKAYGAENVIIEEQFAEFLELDEHRDTQAYLRIVSYSSNDLSVRLVEQNYQRVNLQTKVME